MFSAQKESSGGCGWHVQKSVTRVQFDSSQCRLFTSGIIFVVLPKLMKEQVTMSEKEKAAKSEIQILRDAFEGMKGRQPKSDQELKNWLATDAGKGATMFESTSFSRFGVTGHAYLLALDHVRCGSEADMSAMPREQTNSEAVGLSAKGQ